MSELASECHRSAVGELPFRRGPDRNHDARWRRPQRLDVAPVAYGRPDLVSEDSSVSARIRAIAAATVPSAVPGLPCRRDRKGMGRAGRYRRSPVSPGGVGGSVCSPSTAARRRSSSWPPGCPPAPGPPARHPRQGHTRLAARPCRDRARLCRLHGTLARCQDWCGPSPAFPPLMTGFSHYRTSATCCARPSATRLRSSGESPSRLRRPHSAGT